MLKYYFILFILACASCCYCQSPVNCNDDHTFYPANGTRNIPPVGCDTVYLITKKNYRRIFAEDSQDSLILHLVKKETELLKAQNSDLMLLKERQSRHIDSLNQYIEEKNNQLDTSGNLASQSVNNTEKALKKGRFYKGVSIVTGLIAVVSIILLIIK